MEVTLRNSSTTLFIHLAASPNLSNCPRQNLSFSPQIDIFLTAKITGSLKFPIKRTPSSIRCGGNPNQEGILLTCKSCKTQFDPSLNHPQACRFHTAHFGGETKRKFESVYSGGTMNTPNGGVVLQYWHCCGSEDPFDPGCTAAPHSSYDD
ncbi:hypothetical protein MKW98_021669 [Papaver atlanticum]|uniref:Uncharacterized protein n=1 Tax=Papaver atlanticum TaxID=357466 RepID=A0AAD4T262_9MAGN|nr:hypothetical protein MKW98_021669 [Papaver atlanticum]